MVGLTISHYRIVEKLGEGGMGAVYKAEDIKLERPVALKFLSPHAVEEPEHKARFIREAKAAARLDHPNVCAVYEIDEAQGRTFLAMAYLEGRTVKDKITERPLKLQHALDIAIQTAQGLQAAHEKGVVHRDVKSANIMVTDSPSVPGDVKILDFGLAHLAGRATLTPTGDVVGTPAYMSPEQAQRLSVDRRSDVWSLGVLIYEMVTGRLPFEGAREEVVRYAILNEDPAPIATLRVGVPTELDRIVTKAMAKDPEERYPHASDLLVDLRALRRKLGLGAEKAPARDATEAASPRRVRFGPFEANLHTGELRKHGLKIHLQDLPFRLLGLLLERPGEMVTRDEIREKLWSADTFVEFEHSLNTAISKLRTALGDSAEKSRYIETLPRRGYRFIGTIEAVAAPAPAARSEAQSAEEAAAQPVPEPQPAPGPGEGGGESAGWRRMFAAHRVPWGWAAPAVLLLASGLLWWLMRPTEAPRSPTPERSSIAVLPLQNLTGDPAQEYFVDGMTDAVITDLAQISSLQVISRTSVMHYKKTKKPLPDIARELDVDHIVEGSVVRSGDRVRITVQLVEAGSDSHVWAQNYERDLGDVLALQSAVAQAIAGQIRVQLTPRDQARFASKRRINPKAYEALLKGYQHTGTWAPDEIEKGREYFEQAIAEDPTFAQAYVGLGGAYIDRGFYSGVRPSEVMPKAVPILLKALEIDSNIPRVHRLLGIYRGLYERDWALAEQEFKKAIEMAPGDAMSHFAYAAHYLAPTGRLDEALDELNRARGLAPLSRNINYYVARIYQFRREYDLAVDQLRQTLELDSSFGNAQFHLGTTYGLQGKYDEALAASSSLTLRAWVRALEGRTTEAHESLSKLREISNQRYIPGYQFAYIHAALGERDEAFAWLEKSYHEHEPTLGRLKVDPRFESLHGDPRFTALLKKLNLED